MRRATSGVLAWLVCVGARPSSRPLGRGDWPVAAEVDNPLGCIVTGLEHGGTTVTSELIMTAPGWLGPFEAGFLTAARPAEFAGVWPFNDWARATDASSLGLNGSKWTALVGQRTHLDMYRYALRASPLLRKANTTRFVDKVPGYRENLEAVLRRAPGVPVVFVFKTRASAYASYVTHRHMDEGAFNRTWDAFMRRLDDARRHPRVRAVSYEDLMEARDPEVVRGLFEFIGLPDFWPDAVWKSTSVGCTMTQRPAPSSGEEPAPPRHRAGIASMAWRPDFTGQALKAKRPRCHLCDFHDARVALITTSPTPEPVFGNGTAATRRHARHPEGTLFLGFLLALLVLVAVLGAPCRRSLGDAVLLPDEEDM